MKRIFLSFLGLTLLLTASNSISQPTSTWPNKPIRIIVPFAPGGNVDVTARVVGAGMSKVLNQSVIVENRVGAGGKIGAEAAMKSPPDGYTLMMGSNSSLSVAPNLYKDWPYDPQTGISPVTYLAAVPFVLVVRAGLGPKNLAELITLAKQKPGGLSMASAGNGTSNHLVGEYFQALTGTQFLHVPYKGAGPALQDVVAGRVDLLFDQVSSSAAFIEQGRVTPLRTAFTTRLRLLCKITWERWMPWELPEAYLSNPVCMGRTTGPCWKLWQQIPNVFAELLLCHQFGFGMNLGLDQRSCSNRFHQLLQCEEQSNLIR